MATTGRPITELALGIRDTTGAVVASGKARFYEPGTLTERDVYSDDLLTTAITQPLTLNAGGQYISAYALEATRMIVKDSTETTTYYDGLVNLNRHDAVYVTSPGFNSGNETTLKDALAEFTTSTGAGPNLKESAGATARAIKTVVYEREISVMDFGAAGDGTTPDHVAIQAGNDRLEALGGGTLYFPEGDYLINATITIDAVKVRWRGAGRGVSTIINGSTSGDAINVDMGSAVDCKMTIRDLSISASTTSSGKGIDVPNGNRIHIQDVSVALHRTGIDVSATTSPRLERVYVESTDDNTAGVGVALGARGRLIDSELVCGTTNGTGVTSAGVDSRIDGGYISGFATGASLTGARSLIRGGHVTGATTGVSLGAAGTKCLETYITGATTGVSVGAFANCVVQDCDGASNTTDLSVNASATGLREHNNFATYSSTGATPWAYPNKYTTTLTTSADTTLAWAPTHSPNVQQVLRCTATSAVTLTVTNPTTTNAQPGDVLYLLLAKSGANGISSITWGNLFANVLGTGFGTGSVNSENVQTWVFLWDGSLYLEIERSVRALAT